VLLPMCQAYSLADWSPVSCTRNVVPLAVSVPTAWPLACSYGSITLTSSAIEQTPWPLVRKRTIPTDQPSLVGEI
jgi:hypothetical protein